MNYAGQILNSPYGPLLEQLIFGQSSLQSKLDSLPKTKLPLYEGSYPTYPGSGRVHDGKGSYPQDIDIFEDRSLEGSYPTSSNGTLEDSYSNTSYEDTDRELSRRYGPLNRF